MTVTLRHLRYLQALAATGHFGRAAERCAVTQPALSAQIRDLEAVFGAELVERRPSGAVLTALGQEVLAHAGAILEQVAVLERLARRRVEPLTGALTLGIIPSIAPYLLPDLLPALAAAYPRLDLAIRETVTANLIEEVQAGEIDLALLSLPVRQAGLAEHALFDDPFLLAVPEAMPSPDHGDWLAHAREGRHLLLLEDGHCLREQIVAVCSGVIGPLGRASGVTSLETVLHLVAAGQGITLLPGLFVSRLSAARLDGIRLVPLPDPAPARSVGLVWRLTDPRADDYAALAAALMAAAPREGESRASGRFPRLGH